ncbi:MAG: glycosyltransferase, partial [Alphaproteobacteria bacterium]
MTTNTRTAGFVKSHSQSGKGPVIVQVLPALVRGGVERGTIEMARAIIDAGGKAVVISSGGPLVRHLDRIGAVHHKLPVGVKNPLAWSGLRRKVRRILKDEGADVVHVRSRVPAQIAL